MSIIIRLQGLPLSASSLDIRRFFNGLTIPDGGVHIIGGELGEAFIAFSSDEDARQAMARENENQIKDSKVKLFLSSRNEMKQVIDKARNQHLNSNKIKSTSTATSTSTNQSTQQPQTTLGNGSSTSISSNLNNNLNSNLNRILNSNLSQSIQTDKFDRSTNQINYSNTGTPIASNNNANLIANLQEPPDYRRNRSPNAKTENNNRLTKERSNSPFSNQRVKQLLDQVRTLDAINDNDNDNNAATNSTVRSRLGGFNLPSNSTNFDSQQQINKWNPALNGNQNDVGGVMNGLSMTGDPQSRFLPSNNVPYHHNARSSNPYEMNDNPILFNNQIQPRTNRFIIELRGLPINVCSVDFQTFFRPVGILIDRDQIKLSLDDQALFHGVAHIFFNNEKDLDKALLLNGRFIRDYPIEVLPVVQSGPLLNTPPINQDLPSNMEIYGQVNFNNELSLSNRNGSGDSFTRRKSLFSLFMKGIPYDACNHAEISGFFKPIPIFEIIIIQERSGRPTGNAYIIFDSKEYLDLAMKRNSRYMGKRYIELFLTTIDEIERYRARVAYRNQQKETNNNDNSYSNFNRKRKHSPDRSLHNAEHSEPIYCVQIRGLPPNVDNRDVTAYFLNFGITSSAIHIMLKPDGLNAGECFCEFKSADFLNGALRLDGSRMYNNYILSIKEVSYSKVCSIVGLLQNPKMSKPIRDTVNDRKSTVIASVEAKATINDICSLFTDYSLNLQPNQIEPKLDRTGQRNKEFQQFYIHFRNPKEADRVIRNLNRKHFLDKSIHLKHA